MSRLIRMDHSDLQHCAESSVRRKRVQVRIIRLLGVNRHAIGLMSEQSPANPRGVRYMSVPCISSVVFLQRFKVTTCDNVNRDDSPCFFLLLNTCCSGWSCSINLSSANINRNTFYASAPIEGRTLSGCLV